jgi:hypothetical protein
VLCSNIPRKVRGEIATPAALHSLKRVAVDGFGASDDLLGMLVRRENRIPDVLDLTRAD